jgi:tripartite-type tricarboxylate transporter receptor subunit TctC
MPYLVDAMKFPIRLTLIAFTLLATASSFVSDTRASDYFAGKDVTIHVGFKQNSSFDRYSRLLARHLGRHIPGTPNIRVENSPGSASLRLANLVYHLLPQDGTVIATVASHLATSFLFDNKEAKFDGRKFNWLGSMNNEVTVCAVWHTVPLILWQNLADQPTVMGALKAGTESYISPLVLNRIFHTQISLVTGYPDANFLNGAIQKGQLDGRCGWSWSQLKSRNALWLRDKKIKILLQMSHAKHSALPNVPLLVDFAKTKRDVQILKLIYSHHYWGRPYLVGPRVPAARVAVLQQAFKKTMTDSHFLADARRHNFDLSWIDGPTVQKAIAELYSFPLGVIDAAREMSADPSRIQISRAVIPLKSASGKITNLRQNEREVIWSGDGISGTIRVSVKRTKIVIKDEKANWDALKTGMNCTFTYRASSARRIKCR